MAYDLASAVTTGQAKKLAQHLKSEIEQIENGGGSGGITDAPTDGKVYVRTEESWQDIDPLTQTVETGITEPLDDGSVYIRSEEGWQKIDLLTEALDTNITEAPDDGNIYVRQNGEWVLFNTDLGGE